MHKVKYFFVVFLLMFDKKYLFFGGILAPVFFLLVDVIGGLSTPNHSYVVNAVSELTQAGAENIFLLNLFFFFSALAGLAFGIGLFLTFKDSKSKLLKIGSILIIINAIFSGLTGTIFPMDPFGAEVTFPGTMHVVLVGLSVILVLLLMAFFGVGLNREKQMKSFRLYSIITVLRWLVLFVRYPPLT